MYHLVREANTDQVCQKMLHFSIQIIRTLKQYTMTRNQMLILYLNTSVFFFGRGEDDAQEAQRLMHEHGIHLGVS